LFKKNDFENQRNLQLKYVTHFILFFLKKIKFRLVPEEKTNIGKYDESLSPFTNQITKFETVIKKNPVFSIKFKMTQMLTLNDFLIRNYRINSVPSLVF